MLILQEIAAFPAKFSFVSSFLVIIVIDKYVFLCYYIRCDCVKNSFPENAQNNRADINRDIFACRTCKSRRSACP